LHRLEELAVEAVEGVVEAVAVGVHDQLRSSPLTLPSMMI